MKKTFVALLLALLTSTACTNANAETTEVTTETKIESDVSYTVNLTDVTSYEETRKGLILTFSDETKYLLESAMETEYVYIICDITDVNESYFWALMPNGDVQRFHMVQDPPMDENGAPYFELVVFEVPSDEMENYDNYKTLTVR